MGNCILSMGVGKCSIPYTLPNGNANFSPPVASFSSRPPLLVSYVFVLFKASCEISSYLINFVFVKTYPTSSSGLVPRLDVSRHLRRRDLVQPGARIISS